MLFQPLGTQSPLREALWKTRIGRLVGGRWVLSFLLGLQGFIAAATVHRLLATPCLAVALGLALLNLIYVFVEPLRRRHRLLRDELFLAAQIVLDVGLLGCLVVASGNVSSPFLALLLAPAVAAVLLLHGMLAGAIPLAALLVPAVAAVFSTTGDGAARVPPGGPWYALASLGAALAYCAPVCRSVLRPRGRRRARIQLLRVKLAELETLRHSEQATRARVAERSRQSLIAELATPIAQQIREPLGILRARAESLRLHLMDAPSSAEVLGDLRVLLEQLDVVQRILRGVLSFLPAERVQGRVDVEALCWSELQRIGIDPQCIQRVGLRSFPEVEGSHEELELAIGLLLRLASQHLLPGRRLRLRCRERPGGILHVELHLTADPRLFRASRPSEDRAELATYLRLAILRRILDKHRGRFGMRRLAGGGASLEAVLQRAPLRNEGKGEPPRGRVAGAPVQ